jgi:hypothetical protein
MVGNFSSQRIKHSLTHLKAHNNMKTIRACMNALSYTIVFGACICVCVCINLLFLSTHYINFVRNSVGSR